MKIGTPYQLTLKNGIMKPQTLTITVHSEQPSPQLTLRITSNSHQSTQSQIPKKYIFYFQQLDEQTQPLSSGNEYIFKNLNNLKSGRYNLSCINYPKISCQIEIVNQEKNQEKQMIMINQRKSNTIINLSGLESVEEKEEENKEDFGKEQNQWVKSQEEQSDNPLGTPKKAELSDFDKILSKESDGQQTIENRYLRYFQQQFKIWKDFFTQPIQPQEKMQQSVSSLSTPTKQKPKSEHRKNSEDIETKGKNKDLNASIDIDIDKRQKRQKNKQFFTPDLKYTLSCCSPQNNYEENYKQNFSQFGHEKHKTQQQKDRQKQKSVISLLVNSQQGGRQEQFQKQQKTMKKTNSEYRLNIQDLQTQKQKQKQKKDSQADTASKRKSKILNKNSQKNTSFLEWVDSCIQNQEEIVIKEKDDQFIIKQWLTHLQNKHKIAKFLYG